jgi:hypothetical protein
VNELESIAATFGSSVPVFKIKATGGGELEFSLKNQYSPHDHITDDPVQKLLAEQWRESLNKSRGCYDVHISIESAYRTILEIVREAMLNASPLKNPKQSRLYDWLQKHPTSSIGYNSALSVGFIALYRYIIRYNIVTTRDEDNPHAKNVIAILELMREKYEV